MNLDSLNKWLMLAANLGVLAGIAFLAMEIRLTNDIAVREARTELSESNLEIAYSIIENPELAELMAKLIVRGSELTAAEEVKADQVASILLNTAARLNVNLESGFFTEEISKRHIGALLSFIKKYPGIALFIDNQRGNGSVPPPGVSVVYDSIYQVVDSIGK